jgi:hypothetical protein
MIPEVRSIWRDSRGQEVKVETTGLWELDHEVEIVCYRPMGGGTLLVLPLNVWCSRFSPVEGSRELQSYERG